MWRKISRNTAEFCVKASLKSYNGFLAFIYLLSWLFLSCRCGNYADQIELRFISMHWSLLVMKKKLICVIIRTRFSHLKFIILLESVLNLTPRHTQSWKCSRISNSICEKNTSLIKIKTDFKNATVKTKSFIELNFMILWLYDNVKQSICGESQALRIHSYIYTVDRHAIPICE